MATKFEGGKDINRQTHQNMDMVQPDYCQIRFACYRVAVDGTICDCQTHCFVELDTVKAKGQGSKP
jgi:hypothetical protein